MIHMGMGQKDIIDLRLRHGKRRILKGINSLLHALIHQHVHSRSLQIMTAPCHFMIRSDKNKLHILPFLSPAMQTAQTLCHSSCPSKKCAR